MTAITTVAVSSTHTTLTVVATAFCYYFATVLLTLQTGRVHCSAFAGVSASFITPTFSVRSSSADGARTRRVSTVTCNCPKVVAWESDILTARIHEKIQVSTCEIWSALKGRENHTLNLFQENFLMSSLIGILL